MQPGDNGRVIDALIDRMQALLEPLQAAGDPRRYFHATYLRTTAAVIVAGLSVLTGMFLFLLPARAAALWPWALTPLTGRVLGAIFFLGIAGLGAPADRRWSSAQILLQVAALMLALILVAGARDQFAACPYSEI